MGWVLILIFLGCFVKLFETYPRVVTGFQAPRFYIFVGVIYEGTSNIQLNTIAKMIDRELQ